MKLSVIMFSNSMNFKKHLGKLNLHWLLFSLKHSKGQNKQQKKKKTERKKKKSAGIAFNLERNCGELMLLILGLPVLEYSRAVLFFRSTLNPFISG